MSWYNRELSFLNRLRGVVFCIAVMSMWLLGGSLFAESSNDITAELTEEPDTENEELFTIIIDAGHGGTDSGAVGYADYGNGPRLIKEKDIVLSISNMVVDELRERYPQVQVLTTRSEDVYLSLQSRADFANLYADHAMFVSIHINSHTTGDASGFEVWHIPESKTRYSRGESVGTRENTVLNQKSLTLAEQMIDSLQNVIGPYSRNRGLWESNFYVLTRTFIPGVLVETGFISNEREATNLSTTWYQNLLAEAVVNAISDYMVGEHIITLE